MSILGMQSQQVVISNRSAPSQRNYLIECMSKMLGYCAANICDNPKQLNGKVDNFSFIFLKVGK